MIRVPENFNIERIKILLADDVYDDILKVIANLLPTATSGTKKLIALAMDYFEIRHFCSVGEAINVMVEGFVPDLVITDLDFSSLQEQSCPSYLNYAIECTFTRGWDLQIFVKHYFRGQVPCLILTGQANKPGIFEPLTMLDGGIDYLFKQGDKGFAEVFLTRYIPPMLRLIAMKKYYSATAAEKTAIRTLLENKDIVQPEEEIVTVVKNEYLFKHLFIGWGLVTIDPKNPKAHTIHFADLSKMMDELEGYVSPGDKTFFRGVVKHRFVQDAINEINNNIAYLSLRKGIDRSALHILTCLLEGKTYRDTELDLIGDYDLNKYKKIYPGLENEDFKQTLRNALVLRRILIGAQYLKNNPEFRKRHRNFNNHDFISEILESLGFAQSYTTPEGFKKLINTQLGLSGSGSGHKREETIILGPGKIHPSERRWWEIYGTILLENIKNTE